MSTKSSLQNISNILAILGILGVYGFFIWHTAAYMDRIFEPRPPGDLSDYRDIAAAGVQVAAIVMFGFTIKFIRGQGQDPNDNTDKVPEGVGG